MNELPILINTTLTMLLLMAVGFVAAKSKVIDQAAAKKLSSLIVNVGQPFLMVSSLVNAEFSLDNLKTGGFVVLIAAAVHLIAILLSTGITAGFKNVKEKQISRYGMVFANNAFYGFPILKAVFGDVGVFWGSFYCVVFNLLCWTWGIFALSRANREIKTSPRNLFLNIGTLSVILGVILYVARVPMRNVLYGAGALTPALTVVVGAVKSALTYVGGLCTPISMLLVGAAISRMPFRKLFAKPPAYLVCAVKLIVLPLIVGGLAKLIGLSDEMVLFSAIMAGMPTAAVTEAFAEKYDIVPEYASTCVGMSALLSVATVPLIVLLFG